MFFIIIFFFFFFSPPPPPPGAEESAGELSGREAGGWVSLGGLRPSSSYLLWVRGCNSQGCVESQRATATMAPAGSGDTHTLTLYTLTFSHTCILDNQTCCTRKHTLTPTLCTQISLSPSSCVSLSLCVALPLSFMTVLTGPLIHLLNCC